MNHLRLAVFLLLTFFVLSTQAQVVELSPVFATENDNITITFNADQGDQGLKDTSLPIFAHTGVVTSASNGGWKYVKHDWGQEFDDTQLVKTGANTYVLTIGNPRTFYGVPAGEQILKLTFVFWADAGASSGRDVGGGDIYVDLFESGLNLQVISPQLSGHLPLIVEKDEVFHVEAVADTLDHPISYFRLYAGGTLIEDITNDTLSVDLSLSEEQLSQIVFEVADTSGTVVRDSFAVAVRPDIVDAPLPAGAMPGVNYLGSPFEMTLVLYAPYKEFVYAIGDMNDWQPAPLAFMNRYQVTEDSVYWWVTLSNLTPGTEYAYQYLVDGEITVADPFALKVLDPWNDKFIKENTYPNLKAYPIGKTDGIVATFQTNQSDYVWNDDNFVPPAEENLIIYELLIRDFGGAHSYQMLTDTLDYLQNLGVNAIELMPINEFEGNESWGYNPSFYFALDKFYGPAATFKQFVDAAHERGIAVLVDLVWNHSFGQSPFLHLYQAENGKPAGNNPWYNVEHNFENPEAHWGADFNHESYDTQYLVDRGNRFWMEEYHVDGFRFDFTKGFGNNIKTISGDIWGSIYDADRIRLLKRMADKIWDYNENAYVIFEHLSENSEETELANYGIMLWGNLNYSYNEATMGYHNSSGKSDFSWGYFGARGWEMPKAVTYMESHDEERLMYKNLEYGNGSGDYQVKDLAVALDRMKLANAFFLTIPGPKMIWQFGELGYDISIDFNGRVGNKPTPWSKGYDDDPLRVKLYKTIAALNVLRASHPAFTSAETAVTQNLKNHTKRLVLVHDDLQASIIGNFDVIDHQANPKFDHTGMWYDYFSGDSLNVTDTQAKIALAPGEFKIYTSTRFDPPESGLITIDNETEFTLPTSFSLDQNYPNPFNGSTNINFELPTASQVTLTVYDALGRRIKTIIDAKMVPAGRQVATFDASNFANGLYFYQLEADGFVATEKMVILK